jgi:hypothetical protein
VKVRKFYSAAAATVSKKYGTDGDEKRVARNDEGGMAEKQCKEKTRNVQQSPQQNEGGSKKMDIDKKKDGHDDGGGGDGGGIQKEEKFTFLGLFKSCFAPACTCLTSSASTTITPTFASAATTAE